MSDIDKSPGEKQWDEKNEKTEVGVEVVESQQADGPQKSSRERFAHFASSIFTKKTLAVTGGVLWKFARFTGPGAVISVAYVDPDNLQTNITSGSQFRFKLLFMILFSNVVAVFLQVSTAKIQAFPHQAR
jgi:metal iron transporter